MKSKRNQRSIDQQKFLAIVIFWTITGLIQSFYDHFLIGSHHSTGYDPEYLLAKTIFFNTFAGFIGGIIGGYTLVYVVGKRYRSAPYYKGVLVVSVVFIVAIVFIVLLLSFIQAQFIYGGLDTPSGVAHFKKFAFSTEHIKNSMFWAVVVAFTQLMLHINDKFGQGALWNMISGRYHRPTTQQRIFMFLDLRGSTTIAEQLGNEKYHRFLKAIFSDITDPILSNAGQIYQYVGDEVVISWKQEKGISENRCINCYFDIQEKLDGLAKKYQEQFGVQPKFKAGLHYGEVIAGEVGIIKREITYSGDTLNTAARIQSMCNEHNSDLLISGPLASLLSLKEFSLKSLGELSLRGREEVVELLAVSK